MVGSSGAAEFRRTKFHVRRQGAPSAVFALASFSDPQKIVFDDVDLSRALFHNCDVSAVWFTSSVRWGQRGKGGAMVFEEEIPLDRSETKPLRRNGERDFRALAQIYQQLKKNYDSRLDYWTANEFHFGEMEMKRRAGPTNGRLLWLRQQLHRRMSLVSLYRYVSDYGNSFWKPILWLLGTLVLFTVLYPLPRIGIKRQGATQMETYISRMAARRSLESEPMAGGTSGDEERYCCHGHGHVSKECGIPTCVPLGTSFGNSGSSLDLYTVWSVSPRSPTTIQALGPGISTIGTPACRTQAPLWRSPPALSTTLAKDAYNPFKRPHAPSIPA